MQSFAFLVVALTSGTLVPLQAGANAALGRALGHPLWATIASLAVSAACVLPILIAFRVSAPAVANLSAQPKWIWVGGIAGAIYITTALLLAPKLGAASLMTAVIAGQILASIAIDYFGLVGFVPRPISGPRLLGALLVVTGVLVMQGPAIWQSIQSVTKFSTQH